ncbi:receptor-type tyrosine-protein phosphatase H isoform X1 [Drosophila pseudoobscura]|uniref:Receptor-type tyrosine-protein phosphatase H isoform X1 n=2 Tax=Drosophila pseudoobscura pseudoobscura TaxID=46245 RepID=A0A6I8VS14_DROPS|nr:receptor-type tyrosine-protein phosphatase H isoform X1 [Drosophila pseudoobscura]
MAVAANSSVCQRLEITYRSKHEAAMPFENTPEGPGFVRLGPKQPHTSAEIKITIIYRREKCYHPKPIQCGPKMDSYQWKPALTIYGFILLLLLAWTQAQTDQPSTFDDQELADKVEINIVSTAYTLSFSIAVGDTDYTIEGITCRNGSGKETKANEANVCESLDPCTFYTCVVVLRPIDNNPPTPDQTIYAYTEYKQPRTEVTNVQPTANTIKVTWQTNDRACVEAFEITAKASEYSYTTQQLSEKSTYTFKDVYACLAHTITLMTRNNASVVVDTSSTEVETLYSEPGDLSLNITNLANGITLIKWSDPTEKHCIANYTFKWKRDDCVQENDQQPEETTTDLPSTMTTFDTDYDMETSEPAEPVEPAEPPEQGNRVECEWSDNSDNSKLREYQLTDLQGCEPHTFEIYINQNETSKASQQFTSAEKTASAVSDPVHSNNLTELRWMWSQPQNHPKCVANYSVQLTGPTQRLNETLEVVTEEMVAVFDNLDPCGVYIVEIVPVMLNGSSGAMYQSEATVSEDRPSQILEPVVLPGSYSLEISWQTPAYANLCIDGYRLSGWMEDNKEVLSATTKNTSVTFNDGLLACQMYTIQVIPYTRENLDGDLRQEVVETTAAVVNSDKITLQMGTNGAASHSLTLIANNQDYNNTCQTIFAFFNCSTTAKVRYTYAERYVEGYTKTGFQAQISPLSPNTAYFCDVILYNVAGSSKLKRTLENTHTQNYFPEQPENVNFSQSSVQSLLFTWNPPTYLNGPIKYYQAYLMRHEPDYFVPEDCPEVSENPKSETKGDLSVNFTELSPGIRYMMQVAAQNDFGMGEYTSPIIGITLPTVSEKVTQLDVISMGPSLDATDTYSANATVTWRWPCKSNGEIESFVLDFIGKRTAHEKVEFRRIMVPEIADRKGRMSYTETEMRPEYDYTVNVTVKNKDVDTLSDSAVSGWQSPAGLPSRLGSEVVGQMRVSANETSHPTRSAIVRLPADIQSSESGNITYIALLLSQKKCAGTPTLGSALVNAASSWPDVQSYDTAGADGSVDCVFQYQTTEERWNPTAGSRERGSDDEIIFTIGEDKCPNGKRYCNGPLLADTQYHMVVRLFTKSGYRDAALLEFKTDAAIKVTLILISVCSCLILAFVLGLAVLWVRKRIAWHRDSGQGIEDPFGNVIAKNFAIFYAEVAKPEKLTREFKEITVVALELSYSASELGCHKNRYADIYPYDKNRVILDIDAEGSDYINASFIDGHTRKKEYIATQGPKPESLMDFWRMILQYNVRIIVQVTQFREGNTIKCHEYFPYNMRGLTVTVKCKEYFELYDRTELTVVHDKYGLKEKVVHLYFKKWPDHGCPENPMHLIAFVKKVKSERRPSYSPIVVHCSAGVGRTGTFIGLDLIMQRLKSESKINIFETVKKLRFQRMKMVQTQQQYTFLYACTYELVKHKIPRARKLEGRPKSATATKKVSFPEVSAGNVVASAPSADPENGVSTLQLPARFSGLQRSSQHFGKDDMSSSSNM